MKSEQEIENLTKGNCYIPGLTKAYCYRDHDITEDSCVVCDFPFTENLDRGAGCVVKHKKIMEKKRDPDGHEYDDVHYEDVLAGHICASCFDKLPGEGVD